MRDRPQQVTEPPSATVGTQSRGGPAMTSRQPGCCSWIALHASRRTSTPLRGPGLAREQDEGVLRRHEPLGHGATPLTTLTTRPAAAGPTMARAMSAVSSVSTYTRCHGAQHRWIRRRGQSRANSAKSLPCRCTATGKAQQPGEGGQAALPDERAPAGEVEHDAARRRENRRRGARGRSAADRSSTQRSPRPVVDASARTRSPAKRHERYSLRTCAMPPGSSSGHPDVHHGRVRTTRAVEPDHPARRPGRTTADASSGRPSAGGAPGSAGQDSAATIPDEPEDQPEDRRPGEGDGGDRLHEAGHQPPGRQSGPPSGSSGAGPAARGAGLPGRRPASPSANASAPKKPASPMIAGHSVSVRNRPSSACARAPRP